MRRLQPSAFGSRFWPIAIVVAAIVFVLAPCVHGDWGRDDYFQLAFVRLLDSPWALFVHDHFAPAPGSVFRPLGFASMWLGVELFGTDYAAHAWCGIVLHALAALSLFAMLRRACVDGPAALIATLLFALHPATTGTALWWSARFDVLAALFTFVAMRAAIAYREERTVASLAQALVAALAAILSKEVGVVAIAAIVVQWIHWALVEPSQRRRAVVSIGAAIACVIAYFGWRAAVLGTPASGLTGALPLADAIVKGLVEGVRQMPAYLTFWPRLQMPARMLLVVASFIALVALLSRRDSRRADIALLASGATVLLLPLVLQAPVVALNAQPLDTGQSVIEAAMQSRLYYMGLGGVAMILAVVFDRVLRDATSLRRTSLIVFAIFAGFAVGAMSRDDARAFAERSTRNARLAHAAVSAVDAMVLPESPCHVVFLGIEPPPEWGVFVSMDAVVKALDTRPERVGRCWFHADFPTWFFLQPTPVAVADALPYEPLRLDGREVPWLAVGNATVAYLSPPRSDIDAAARARMRWLQWNGNGFDDVSDEVSAGRLPIRLDHP